MSSKKAAPEDFILAILHALPEHSISGKKRLQKLAFLLDQAGFETDASFRLKDYGPFSAEIARAADYLAAIGQLSEKQQSVGRYEQFMTVYKLSSDKPDSEPTSDCKFTNILKELNDYSTIELEVASTIKYFMNIYKDMDKALESTRSMKPSKTIAPVIQKSHEILKLI